MSRRQRAWKKFHNKARQIKKISLLGVGVLCALAAALLLGSSVRAAVSVSGLLQIGEAGIKWDRAEPDNTLVYWHVFQVTSEKFDLNNTYNPNSSEDDSEETDSETLNPGNPVEVSVGSYNSEEVFQPDILDPALNWSVKAEDGDERNSDYWSQTENLGFFRIR